MASRIFWAVLQAKTHLGAILTWGFIDATVNLSVQTTQNPELMAKIGPKTCKTAQNYMSEVNSKMRPARLPARARLAACAKMRAYGGDNGPVSRIRRSQRAVIGQ